MTRKTRPDLCIGMDVAKDHLDLGQWPEKRTWQVPNSDEGIDHLITELTRLAPTCIVCEASGGYEHTAVAALATAGLPVAVVNPRQVRDFAKASGQLAKTDRLDALVLAHFAAAMRPEPRPLPDAETEALHALLVRRTQVVAMLVAEKNRLTLADPAVRDHITQHIAWLETQQHELDTELRTRVHASPLWRTKESLLQSITGIGPVASITLLAALPELGQLSHKQIASLAGLAPFARESGTLRGKRMIWGGRAVVRRALYMATLSATRFNPAIRAVYTRLCTAGKPPKVALTACMRKLLVICNALIRTNTPWRTDYQRPLAA